MIENLDQNYVKAGYHARQSWGKRPAVVLIDFAKAYFDSASPLFGGEGCQIALENSLVLADAARAVGVPVIFTEVKYQPGGSDGGAFYAKVPALSCFDAGSETQKLMPPLEIKKNDILISKQYPSGFLAPHLHLHCIL